MMLAFIEELAVMMGEQLYTKAGQRRFGKHSWRASGAVRMASIGLGTYKIKLLGRWLCAIVLRYCRLAPMSDVARDYRTASHNTKSQDARANSASANAKMVKNIEDTLEKYDDDNAKLFNLIKKVEADCAPHTFIINRKTGKVHKALTLAVDGPCCNRLLWLQVR